MQRDVIASHLISLSSKQTRDVANMFHALASWPSAIWYYAAPFVRLPFFPLHLFFFFEMCNTGTEGLHAEYTVDGPKNFESGKKDTNKYKP